MIKNITSTRWFKILVVIFFTAFCSIEVTANTTAKITVTKTNYQGWRDSYILSNGQVEAVVVPKVGRIMQFRFKGGEGTFWENEQVYGKAPNVKSEEWSYFGAGHLPLAAEIYKGLTPLIIFYIVFLNSLGGTLFGWLYWRRGILAAMIAHFGANIILHVIPALFVK